MRAGAVIYCGSRSDEAECIAQALGSQGLSLIVCGVRLLNCRSLDETPGAVLIDMSPDVPRMAKMCLAFRARPHGRGIPMILVYDRNDSEEILLGFGVGADDCLVRPLHPQVAAAHVQAVIRRYHRGAHQRRIVCAGPLRFDRGSLTVSLRGKTVGLTPTEFTLLEMLACRQGSILRRSEAISHLRLSRPEALPHSLETHFFNLRRKLGPRGRRLVETVSGIGYRLKLQTDTR